MSRSGHEYLQHIAQETHYLRTVSTGLTHADMVADETLKRAITRSIEIIGEAVKQLPEPIRHQYPQIPWRAIAGMRDRLIHSYFSVDYDIVWDVVVTHIPPLDTVVRELLHQHTTP